MPEEKIVLKNALYLDAECLNNDNTIYISVKANDKTEHHEFAFNEYDIEIVLTRKFPPGFFQYTYQLEAWDSPEQNPILWYVGDPGKDYKRIEPA